MTVGKDVSGLFPDVLKNMVSRPRPAGCVFRGAPLTLDGTNLFDETANGRPRTEKAGIPLPHELRQDTTRARHLGRQHICQGKTSSFD